MNKFSYKKLFFALLLLIISSVLFLNFRTIESDGIITKVFLGFPFDWLTIEITPITVSGIKGSSFLFGVLGFILDLLVCYLIVFAVSWLIQEILIKIKSKTENKKSKQ